MADAGLFIGWGEVVRGRETEALEVFNETLAYYGRLQEEGTVENFEPVFLERSFDVMTERNGGIDGYLRDELGVDSGKRALIERRLFG